MPEPVPTLSEAGGTTGQPPRVSSTPPAEVKAIIESSATEGVLRDVGSDSPNLLLYAKEP